jgi:hypothetical protein
MQSSEVSKTISLAGFGVRRDLKRVYGSPEAAERAVRDAMSDTEALEMWASMVTAKRHSLGDGGYADEYGAEFSFDALSQPLRDVAMQSIAVAMLVWTAKQEGRI